MSDKPITGYSNGKVIEVGKTYNGATVVEIAPGADKYSPKVIKFTGSNGSFIGYYDSEGNYVCGVHRCSEEYFVKNFMNE